MKRISSPHLLSLLIVSALLTGLPGRIVNGQSDGATITATGRASMMVDPDIVQFKIEVSGRDSTALDTKADHDRRVRSVLEILAELGVPAENIKTDRLQLGEDWIFDRGKTRHQYTQTIEITLKDIEAWEYVLQRAFDAGATGIGGVQFMTSKKDSVQLVLHERALRNALEKADRLARASGLRLGRILVMSDGEGSLSPYIRSQTQRDVAATQLPTPDMFLALGSISSPGQIELNASVQITCELIDP